MNAEKRRENILKLLAESDSPLSGTDHCTGYSAFACSQ